MTGDGVHHREVEAGTQVIRRYQLRAKPPGTDRYMGAGRGRQGRGESGTWRRAQRRVTEAGGYGISPGGRRTTPGEEVGSRCKYIEMEMANATDGEAVGGRRSIV